MPPRISAARVSDPAPQTELRRIRLANGLTLDCLVGGEAGGRPVVFLHGYTDSCHSLVPVLEMLPRQFRALAPSQRGHGDSDRPEGAYRIRDMARDVAELLDALAIPRAAIVGHSMGSLVAQRFAIDHRERLSALVLVGAFPTLRGNAPLAEFRDKDVAALSDPVPRAFARDFQQSTLARAVPEDFFRMAVDESLKLPARTWRAVLDAHFEEDTTAELGAIRAPTLVIWGDKDSVTGRENQGKLLAGIRGARFWVDRDGGHAPHWEQPSRIAAEVAAFLDGPR